MKIKNCLTAALIACAFQASAQSSIDNYFEKIRTSPTKLTAFMSAMPKGGDLHHHYSGSVYAETYLNYVISKNYYVNTTTLDVKETLATGDNGYYSFASLEKNKTLAAIKELILQKWSVKDYNGVSTPSDQQFFQTFKNFGVAVGSTFETGLLEIKDRARKENVSYIETMFTSIKCDANMDKPNKHKQEIDVYLKTQDVDGMKQTLEKIYTELSADPSIVRSAKTFNDSLAAMHKRLKLDDNEFTIRYMNYVQRTLPNPVELFKNLMVAFESANKTDLIVGVNIVAPENDDMSMKYYWAHMEMFKFMHEKYPNVKYSMHAGELCMGMVKPEDLTWHINSAVRDAKANRIGHGVDLPYEANSYELLRYMSNHEIPIEINLLSNEFILKIKDENHPVTLYKEFNVPIVISTDDAGVLRNNLIENYIALAQRYKNISYSDIKKFVFNSLKYSFIEEPEVKKKLTKDLEQRFEAFESQMMRYTNL